MPSSSEVVRKWGEMLSRVAAGEEIEITRYGRRIAVLRKAQPWMTGEEFMALLEKFPPNPEAADAIEEQIELYRRARSRPIPPEGGPTQSP